MSKSTNRLIARAVGAVLIAVLIGFLIRLTYQFNSLRSSDRHPCGPERQVVFNYTERELLVNGLALQEDGSFQNVEVALAPNQSSEEAGLCHVEEMTTLGAKAWSYKGTEMRPTVWRVISTQYTYCISGEESSSGVWYEVLCSKELAGRE